MTKTLPTSLKALHIGVVREGRFIEDRWFKGEIHVTVGTGEKNTFALPLSTLGASQPLFMQKQGKVVLHFNEKARGKLTVAEGKELELSECRKQGLATPKGGYFEMPLSDEMRGRITLGEVSFVFNFATPPPTPPKPELPKEARGTIWNVTDHTFFTILMISLALHGCMIAAISRRDLPPEDAAMEEIPDRFAKLLIPEKPPEEPEKPKEEEKAPEPEKEVKKEEPKKEEPAKDSAEHKANVQKAVAQKGLLHILSATGGPGGSALASVFSNNGAFTSDIDQALKDAGGVAVANAGGPTRKGESSASAQGIGNSIGTSGGGGSRLGEKKDVDVHGSVSASGDDAEVDSSSVDKDALARFIKLRLPSIRSCYENQLKRSPSLRGKIVIQFTITARGTVSDANSSQDTMSSDEVTGCIIRLIKLWRLPFKPDSDVTVSFPFIFSPAN
jgi:hypothetical protein